MKPLKTLVAAGLGLLMIAAPATAGSGSREPGPLVLAKEGNFYVRSRGTDQSGLSFPDRSMFVEYRIPLRRTGKFPIVLIHGNYQSGANFFATPDGRPGWAQYLLRKGYAVYLVDQSMRGRSPYDAAVDGPRSIPSAQRVESLFTAPAGSSSVPQTRLHTQWPGTGKQGDPVFDQFYMGLQPTVMEPSGRIDGINRAAIAALLAQIGPAIILTHSRAGTFGWEAADDSPGLVRAVVAVEPNGPPFYDITAPGTDLPETMSRPWGITYDRLTFAPSIDRPEQLKVERQVSPAGKDLMPCWLQAAPARQLPRLANVPVMIVTGEASYHAPYDHCTALFLHQAGVNVTFQRLEDAGIRGNGHLMMLERNSDAVIARIAGWLARAVR